MDNRTDVGRGILQNELSENTFYFMYRLNSTVEVKGLRNQASCAS